MFLLINVLVYKIDEIEYYLCLEKKFLYYYYYYVFWNRF